MNSSREELMPPPVCGGRCPEGAEGGHGSLLSPACGRRRKKAQPPSGAARHLPPKTGEGMSVTPFRRCAPPSPADGGRHEFFARRTHASPRLRGEVPRRGGGGSSLSSLARLQSQTE